MRVEELCLIQLLELYKCKQTDAFCDDIIVYHLYICRKILKANLLRTYLFHFVGHGFNPFSPTLSASSKVMMKSVISKCDSVL